MEYKKDYKNFSFGFGSQKVAGKGNLSSLKNENTPLSEVVLKSSLALASGVFKLIIKKK